MGQDRGGLYSFEKIEDAVSLCYPNADQVHPDWQGLAPGDTVRLVPKRWMGLSDGLSMRVVDVEGERCIVARVRSRTSLGCSVVLPPDTARARALSPSDPITYGLASSPGGWCLPK